MTRAIHGPRPSGRLLRSRSYSPILANGGVLAPNAKLRSQVVPEVEEEEESRTGGAVCWEEERKGQTVRCRWVPWAKLLLKVFGSDVFQCSQCDGRMQRIAYITQPRIIAAILECAERKEEPP